MKATGIVRKLDDLGRITLPKELRKTLKMKEGDPIEIYTFGKQVILEKYEEVRLDEMDLCWLKDLVERENVDDPCSETIKAKMLKYIDNEVGLL